MSSIPTSTLPGPDHAPMLSKVASIKGLLAPVDYRKKTEARRIRKQEKRTWRREVELNQ